MRLAALRVCALAVFVFACVTPRMQAPEGLARDAEVFDATDRTNISGGLFDESFRLGPYAVTDVHRLQNSSEEFAVALSDGDETEGGYEYTVVHGKTAFKGSCRTVARGKKLACSCASTTATATFSIQDENGTFVGTIATSSGRYRVTSVHELEGGAGQNEPSGYRVDGNGLVGAVDVTPPGRAWLGKSVAEAERNELACSFVGLMLYEPPESAEK